jgi:hypothetical protein
MGKFNIMRPLLLLAVAYFAKTFTTFICTLFAASEGLTSNLSFIAMMAAGIITFIRLNKTRNKR